MTMIPTVGYFLVVPKIGPKWIEFKSQLEQAQVAKRVDEQTCLKEIMPTLLKEFSWKFCFLSETEIFFQCEMTENFEKVYGDIDFKIREHEFYLLNVLEQELLSGIMREQLLALDNYFTLLDSYLSLTFSVEQFNLQRPTLSKTSTSIQVSNAQNLLTKLKCESKG